MSSVILYQLNEMGSTYANSEGSSMIVQMLWAVYPPVLKNCKNSKKYWGNCCLYALRNAYLKRNFKWFSQRHKGTLPFFQFDIWQVQQHLHPSRFYDWLQSLSAIWNRLIDIILSQNKIIKRLKEIRATWNSFS